MTVTIHCPIFSPLPTTHIQDANTSAPGLSCTRAIWQTGLTFYGNGTIDNWFEWWPVAPARYRQPFAVSPGDKVRMTVHATSATSGNSTLENLTTGQSTFQQVSGMQYSLCMTDADWIFEDFEQVDLADFGTVEFYDTHASGEQGDTDSSGSSVVEIVADGREKTSCGTNADGVVCKYLG